MVIKTYDAYTRLSTMEADRFANFLFDHQEGKRATKKAIRKAIQYSTKDIPGLGGYVFAMEDKNEILGLAVVNKTGMGDYIPAHAHNGVIQIGTELGIIGFCLSFLNVCCRCVRYPQGGIQYLHLARHNFGKPFA